MKKEIIEWVKSLIFAIVVVLVIQMFIQPTIIFHKSMVPTLEPKDFIIIKKTKNVERNNIIVFKSNLTLGEAGLKELPFYKRIFTNKDTKKRLIKRVIGMPGDKIFVDGDNVYINDVLVNEQFAVQGAHSIVTIDKIPEDYYFLMGDNRPISLDSRDPSIGLVSKKDIEGVAIFRLFPFSKIGSLHDL